MGPWWMTIQKLETDLRTLTSEVDATAALEHLAHAPTVAAAQAAVAQATAAFRKIDPPDGRGRDQLLRRASDAITQAEGAMGRARGLREMALRRKARPMEG